MTIGSYTLSAERAAVMSPTIAYMSSSFGFAFKRDTVLDTPISRLLAPFQEWLWVSILTLLSISVIVIFLSKKLSSRNRHFIIGGRVNRTPIINMVNAMVGNVIPNPIMTQRRYFGTFARTLTIFWIFFWLIVRNAYLGSLYDCLKSQPDKSLYDTVEQVLDSNCDIFIISTTVDIFSEDFDRNR